ncbi:TPA: arsenate reductase ArsC [Pseudomonas aeruginosa]|nr:arsenate reductase ArsC [Pseudomonas aeruginosa]QGL85413.1 arsenate reductase ArsC [Stenotrophomonas maltophilia]MBI8786635.1 arsenate reductase ArsC [Pseudomonas aeruginosa]MCO2824393.1 arsenate reductase ArsC [Pseudomonas aeruginosa]MCO3133400.1 arsenate reductase ArsC [Pseudomonas aeruginosa]HBP5148453.1 arsenate reductase ArsC [Pseudomonas aeruginosa]
MAGAQSLAGCDGISAPAVGSLGPDEAAEGPRRGLLEPKNRSASVSIPSYETILTLNSSPRTSGRGSAEVPKSWDEFVAPGAPVFDFIFTVCDNAAGEACPFWPGKPVSAHWGVPDPAAVEGSEEQRLKAFKDAALTLRRRIELFLSLPLQRLDAMSLQRELRNIGQE